MGYFSADHVSENSTVLQISVEEFEKVCVNCRNAQLVILWLKSLNYVHVMTLHDATKVVQQDINRFKVRDNDDDDDDTNSDDDDDDDDDDLHSIIIYIILLIIASHNYIFISPTHLTSLYCLTSLSISLLVYLSDS